MEETTTTTTETAKRPGFLTVLCILSFIAAGISIIFLILGMGVKGAVESNGIDMDAQMASAGVSEAAAAFSWPSMLSSIVLTIIGLVGVIMMWKLKKMGFYIYVGTGLLGILMPIVFGASFSVMGAFFPVLFIVLYALNLKHLK